MDQLKSKNNNKKINIQDLSAQCSEKWKKLKDEEKKKYSKLFEDEKVKFKADIELVRHYLFKDFNDRVHRPPTAYRKKENDNWFLKADKIKKVSPISLFIQKKIQEAKEKFQEPPSLKEIAPAWKKLSKNEKKSYERYAQELNDEKTKLQDIYDIVHGVKPKKPAGAFRVFLQEKAKNNEIKALNEGYEMWKKLSDDQREFSKSRF